jgi:hypothetical protein
MDGGLLRRYRPAAHGLERRPRPSLLVALRRYPVQPVDVLPPLLTLLRFRPPGIARWVGRVG